MKKTLPEESSGIFWTTVIIVFVLLVHNGTEPLFLVAMALFPVLILKFLYKKSLRPLAVYLIIFGLLGRYTRYFRQTYASDTLLAIQDHIGYFLAGKNVYEQVVMAQSGPTPFTYLPFSLFWYLPARLLTIDLRFFEMFISATVPLLVLWYGRLAKTWKHLPVVAVVALTPFLLDLSADGSNDNSAIFLLLSALVAFMFARRFPELKRPPRLPDGQEFRESRICPAMAVSAVLLGLAASFKHYLAFFVLFFLVYAAAKKMWRYLGVFFLTIGIVSLPFILASPTGFFRSLFFIEIGNFHTVWGWNIWVALRDGFGIVISRREMWMVRTGMTGVTILGLLKFFRLRSIRDVCIAGSVSMLVYLVTSDWTTYAYFTFLVPLIGLGAVAGGGEKL